MSLKKIRRRLSATFRFSIESSLSELAEHLTIDENGEVNKNHSGMLDARARVFIYHCMEYIGEYVFTHSRYPPRFNIHQESQEALPFTLQNHWCQQQTRYADSNAILYMLCLICLHLGRKDGFENGNWNLKAAFFRIIEMVVASVGQVWQFGACETQIGKRAVWNDEICFCLWITCTVTAAQIVLLFSFYLLVNMLYCS